MRSLLQQFFTLIVLFGSLLTGCVEEDVDKLSHLLVGETASGSFYTVDSTEGLTTILISNDEAFLKIQAVDGVERPEEIQKVHPEIGPNEIDYRVVDKNGIPFIMGWGGDDYADLEWMNDYEVTRELLVFDQDRIAHYRLLQEAENVVEQGKGLLDSFHAKILLDMIAATNHEQQDMPINPEPDFGVGGGGLRTVYTHYAAIYYDPLFWLLYGADHSATRAKAMNSSQTVTYNDMSYGNHGSFWNDSSMTYLCSGTFSNRASTALTYSYYAASDTSFGNPGGGCSTSYGFVANKHVCNDDSYAQYGNVKYNSYSSWVTCGDSNIRYFAPFCSSI